MFNYPDIVKQFCCKMCGACCRHNWLVTVDEAGFNRNRHLFYKMGKAAEFTRAFQRITGPAGPGEYAYIAKDADGVCRFLQTDNLCMLHRLAGHDHLDSVCQTFPRYPMNSSRGIEVTLSFSCPAALQMVERVEPLHILRADERPVAFTEDSFVEHVFPRQKRSTDPLYYYFELEQHFIDILQCRAVALAERMALLQQTVQQISGADDKAVPGQRLNRIFADNYTFMEGAGNLPPVEKAMAEIIIEHYLVNIIFRKIFYTYGLAKGWRILNKFYRFIRFAACATGDEKNTMETTKRAVVELEFRFGHHRSSLGEL